MFLRFIILYFTFFFLIFPYTDFRYRRSAKKLIVGVVEPVLDGAIQVSQVSVVLKACVNLLSWVTADFKWGITIDAESWCTPTYLSYVWFWADATHPCRLICNSHIKKDMAITVDIVIIFFQYCRRKFNIWHVNCSRSLANLISSEIITVELLFVFRRLVMMKGQMFMMRMSFSWTTLDE